MYLTLKKYRVFSKNLWKSFNHQDLDGIYLIPDSKDPFKFYGACFIRSGCLKGHAAEFTINADHDKVNVTWKDDQFNTLEPTKTLLEALKLIKSFLNTQAAAKIPSERPKLFSELITESHNCAVTKNRK